MLLLLGDGVVVPRVPALVQTSARLAEYPGDDLVHLLCHFIPYLRSHSHFPEFPEALAGSIQSAVPSEGLQMPCKEKSVYTALIFPSFFCGEGEAVYLRCKVQDCGCCK